MFDTTSGRTPREATTSSLLYSLGLHVTQQLVTTLLIHDTRCMTTHYADTYKYIRRRYNAYDRDGDDKLGDTNFMTDALCGTTSRDTRIN